MKREKVIIVGAGPCGLAAAIRLQEKGVEARVIEKDNIVSSIFRYPTHQTFFSTARKLEIGDVPFYSTNQKPKRNEALVYYREVVERKRVSVNRYESVQSVEPFDDGTFHVETRKQKGEYCEYHADYVIIATGYYDHPNALGVAGEELSHVYHYFKEAHPYQGQQVVVIGGKNSAVDAAMELEKAGAQVTVIYRGADYSPKVKPWILPQFTSLVNNGHIQMVFEANITEITQDVVRYVTTDDEEHDLPADFVFAMIGYHPDHAFLEEMGVKMDATSGRPFYKPDSMETNVKNLFIAGVIAAGNNANEIFIETGRHHGDAIAEVIAHREISQ
ncbi:YpdA family putative bacillithiol disulfide reductase [Geomicrobium sp. JSM 1781026]|uniref:YpdA family putative bacillithiol disulfide reductase n=1 Tax=Geomicrobium sp. JSM 1781026 TaxID=3344580 RepID=UPI0035BF177E